MRKKFSQNIIILLIILGAIGATLGISTLRDNLVEKDKRYNDQAVFISNSDILKGNTIDYMEASNVKIPIITYSFVSYNDESFTLTADDFKAQMKWLYDNGVTFVTMKELYEMITTGNNIPKRPVAICFEEGYDDVYKNAYPILKQYGVKATVFLSSQYINKPSYLTEGMIKDMALKGINFQSHSKNNTKLTLLTYEEQLDYLKSSQERIQAITNTQVEFLMYPEGSHDGDTTKAMSSLGYKLGISNRFGYAEEGNGLYNLRKIKINYNNKDLKNFKDIFVPLW